MYGLFHRGSVLASVAVALVLAGCSSTSLNRAPVEDRAATSGKATAAATAAAPVVKPPPGFENAGKPGYYTVKPSDTLIRIGLENGQSHKDIARWNALENPNRIEVGQVLRVIPPVPGDATPTTAIAKPVTNSAATSTPLAPASSAAAASPASSSATTAPAAAGSAAATSAAATTAAAVVSGSDEDLGWIWPSKGPILAEFDESKNKGVDIGGAAGDPVLASADGKVVYAGEGLRGYGKLIILKHNSTFLTAYAHNQTLLVKEDQTVKKGQKIAEMGNSDTDRVKLHFEVRRQGKPVDPTKYLPSK
jgi:lipoprotein NlpD